MTAINETPPNAVGTRMKAVLLPRYGGPEVLDYTEVPRPTPGPGEVLLSVRATSINAADYRTMRADPFLVRIKAGWFGPKKGLIHVGDVAGVVEKLGPDVQRLNVGDEVFGDAF